MRRLVGIAVAASLALAGVVGFPTVRPAAAATIPLASWTFEEGSGVETADLALHGHDGILRGATWTSGRTGGGLAFDGTGDHVEVGTAVDLALTRTIEIDLQVRFDSGAGTRIQKLVEKTGAPVPYGARVSNAGRIGLFWAGSWRESDPLSWSNGTWYRVNIRHDGTTITFAREGAPAGSVANSDPTTTSSGALYLGRGAAGWERPLHGRLDDVSIAVPIEAGPAVTATDLSATSLPAGTPLTVTAAITGSWANPDAPDSVAVGAQVTRPDGVVDQVPGFLLQDFQVDDPNGRITPVGAPTWTIRYTPRRTGAHTVTVTASTPMGASTSAALGFTATAAPAGYRGFVRLSPSSNKRYYEYVHSGESFYSFGPNLDVPVFTHPVATGEEPGEPMRGLFGDGTNKPADGATPENLWLVYDRYRDNLQRMAAAGANTARLRVDSRFLPLELFPNAVIPGYPTGVRGFSVGRYHGAMAWIVDQVVELARQHDIVLQVAAWNGNGSMNWGDSQYALNKNQALVKQRLRYDIARWGYSPSVLSWEYFNELPASVDPSIDPFWTDITDWLRDADINGHLITSSNLGGGFNNGIDQKERHLYVTTSQSLLDLATFTTGTGKPAVISEFGQRRYFELPPGTDPQALRAREGVWASLVGHKSGAWYWWMHEHLDPAGLYLTAYQGIAAFTAAEELRDYDWQDAGFTAVSGPGGLTYHGMVDLDRALIWISRTPSHEPTDRPPANGNVVDIAGLRPSTAYTLQWWDTSAGTITSTQSVTATSSGAVRLAVPDGVTRDIAAKLIR